MSAVIIAEPINKINIKYNKDPYNIEISINELGTDYIVNILDKEIPIARFDLKTFYSLLQDILINKKDNSTYNLNFKENKCFLQCSMELKDYLKTEYKFILILNPTDRMSELSYEIELLKKDNKELKENVKELKENIKENVKKIKLIDIYGLSGWLASDKPSRIKLAERFIKNNKFDDETAEAEFIYFIKILLSMTFSEFEFEKNHNSTIDCYHLVYSTNVIIYSNGNEMVEFMENEMVEFIFNKYIYIYLDDLIIHSKTFFEKYSTHLNILKKNFTHIAINIFLKYLNDIYK